MPKTKPNVQVLTIKETYQLVERHVFNTLDEATRMMRRRIERWAQADDVMADELRDLADVGDSPSLQQVIHDLSKIDLIEWWVGRREGNEMSIVEAQDRTA